MEENTPLNTEMTGEDVFYIALMVVGCMILIPVVVDFAINSIEFVGNGAVKLYNKIRGRKATKVAVVDKNGRVVGHVTVISPKEVKE